MRRRFVYWYMDKIAGRRCPCGWAMKIKPLIKLCGKIDDAFVTYEGYGK